MEPDLVSCAVMAHPARKLKAEWVQGHLEGAPIIYDEKSDRWDTGRRSMLAGIDPARPARFHLVVQDDALPCANFMDHVRAALSTLERGPVAFYMGRTGRSPRLNRASLESARARGLCWLPWQGPWWGVAVAVETKDIAPMIEWGDGRPDILNYDRRMARYFDSIGRRCMYSIPSLVDHRNGLSEPSLIPGRTSLGRDALWAPKHVHGPWTSRTFDVPIIDPTPPAQRASLGHELR